jgi:hypothetical protein
VTLWVSYAGYIQVGVLMNAGGAMQVRNTTIRAYLGWSQAIVSLEKHGIGAPANKKTRLTVKYYNVN